MAQSEQTPIQGKLPACWKDASRTELLEVRGICFDIDDTFSSHGKIHAEAYQALWALKNAGFALVPITGRPAGWCDHIARFWPVDAVVGENGAFSYFMQNGKLSKLITPGAARDPKPALSKLHQAILKQIPKAQVASDQDFRRYDLAIDFCEDVPPWNKSEVEELLDICREKGAHAKVSSIHVNAWFGNYDKKSGFKHWLNQGAPGCNLAEAPKWDEWLFIGDSPNDEPLFEGFGKSVGVANLRRFLPSLTHPPHWITEHESGAGFAEMAQRLVLLKLS